MKIIFLADDDAVDRDFFRDALKEVSFPTQLVIAKDGVELMTLLDEIETDQPPPDAIFLDLNMPRKNGYECLKEIRENDKIKNVPVIIISTTANEKAVETTYSLRANCYICKPNTHHHLKKAIETAFELSFCQLEVRLSKEKFVLAIS